MIVSFLKIIGSCRLRDVGFNASHLVFQNLEISVNYIVCITQTHKSVSRACRQTGFQLSRTQKLQQFCALLKHVGIFLLLVQSDMVLDKHTSFPARSTPWRAAFFGALRMFRVCSSDCLVLAHVTSPWRFFDISLNYWNFLVRQTNFKIRSPHPVYEFTLSGQLLFLDTPERSVWS